jgi:hypothetical protein
VHEHVAHGRAGVRRQRVPDLQAAQQRDRAGVEGIGTHILPGAGQRRRAAKRHGEAEPGEGEGQGLADDAAAGDPDVEGTHRVDCR